MTSVDIQLAFVLIIFYLHGGSTRPLSISYLLPKSVVPCHFVVPCLAPLLPICLCHVFARTGESHMQRDVLSKNQESLQGKRLGKTLAQRKFLNIHTPLHIPTVKDTQQSANETYHCLL